VPVFGDIRDLLRQANKANQLSKKNTRENRVENRNSKTISNKSISSASRTQYANNNEILKKVLEESIQTANGELKKRINLRKAQQKVSTLSNNSKLKKKLNKYANLYANNNTEERIRINSIQTERNEREKRMKERRAAASATPIPPLPPLSPLPPLPGSSRRFRPSSIFNTHIPRMFGYSGNKTFRKK